MDAISLPSPTDQPPNNQIRADRGEMAALSALSDNPWHLPVNGLCLEQLLRKGLIEPANGGYALTQMGVHLLATEIIPPTIGRGSYPDSIRAMSPAR